jgi:hypothetical protein
VVLLVKANHLPTRYSTQHLTQEAVFGLWVGVRGCAGALESSRPQCVLSCLWAGSREKGDLRGAVSLSDAFIVQYRLAFGWI